MCSAQNIFFDVFIESDCGVRWEGKSAGNWEGEVSALDQSIQDKLDAFAEDVGYNSTVVYQQVRLCFFPFQRCTS